MIVRAGRGVATVLAGFLLTSVVAASPSSATFEALPDLKVAVQPAFFNPSLGQKVEISAVLPNSAVISISILDPDGLVVRHLISRSRAPRGRRAWVWDGRDDVGEVVSDEAYSFKLDIGSRTAYFPASERQQEISIERAEFDAHRGLISYELPRASRVRITASDGVQGGISRVIVDWQPRTAGSILEPWNGFDESGQINILSSRESRISIEARALSKNPLIALGNRRLNFQDRKAKRAGESLLTK